MRTHNVCFHGEKGKYVDTPSLKSGTIALFLRFLQTVIFISDELGATSEQWE